MAASFAAYASQFIARQQNVGTASMASSQPLFFSFTTDDGSRAGHELDTDLDDFDDPHLRDSGRSTQNRHNYGDEDDDPYLRLDEDERTGRTGHDSRHAQSIPLISSEHGSLSPDSPKGWLAHLASPMMHESRARTPSPSPSRSDSSDSGSPPDFFHPETIRVQPPQPPPPPAASREPVSLSLTESLLPRDGLTRPLDVFSLPDPRHTSRRRRKYHDSLWTAMWCTGVTICVFFSVLSLFLKRKSTSRVTPYTTLLHTVPMLTILTFLSAAVAYTHILLLRIFVRPVMIATSVFIPVTLFISAVWAFIGSFMWDTDTEPTWGETVGLRLFSIIPLVLSLLTARRLVDLPRQVHTTSATLTLTTELLIANPFLLALSPAILLVTLLASIPFLTLIFRLLLIGYVVLPSKGSPAWEGHVHGWANWAIAGTVVVWLWTWGVARGILRMTASSVIGAWYFAEPDTLPPRPTSTHTIHAALTRSTGPNLGTVALSALLLTLIQLLILLTTFLHRLPLYIPARAFFLVTGIRFALSYLESVTTVLSKYALVYAGLTGDPFMPSARRARALTSGAEGRRKGFGAEPPLTLLTVAPLTMTFPFALTTYLFVAHTLGVPDQALGAAMLSGGVTALVGLFCVGLVKDTADTLYMCYCIDKGMGERRREEVFVVFEYDRQGRQTQDNRPRQETSRQGREPQESHTTYPEPRQLHPKQRSQQPQPPSRPQTQPSAPPSQSYIPSVTISRQPLSLPSPPPLPSVLPLSSTAPAVPAAIQTVLEEGSDVDPFLDDRPVRTAEMNVNQASMVEDEDEDEGPADGSQFFPGSGFF